LYTTEVLY